MRFEMSDYGNSLKLIPPVVAAREKEGGRKKKKKIRKRKRHKIERRKKTEDRVGGRLCTYFRGGPIILESEATNRHAGKPDLQLGKQIGVNPPV